MKRLFLCIWIISWLLTLSGCHIGNEASSDSESVELYEALLPDVQYQTNDVRLFCADPDGGAYCIGSYSDTLQCFSSDGLLTGELGLPSDIYISSITSDEKGVYFLGKRTEKAGLAIGCVENEQVDIIYETGECEADSYSALCVLGEKLYFSALGADAADIEYADGFYHYDGRMIYCLDLTTGECSSIMAENPLCFSESSGGLLLYCCDSNGFYFVEYDGAFGEKRYCDLGELYAFCPIGDNVVAYPKDGTINASLISERCVSSVLVEASAFGYAPLALADGCLVYSYSDDDGETVKLSRIKPYEHIKNLYPIDVIMSIDNSSVINTAGYAVGMDVVSENELSTKMLTRDSSWDAAVVYSRQSIAAEITDNGDFYPMDDYAAEYLAQCPPSVQTVCTKDGAIWAIPLEINTGCVIYNEQRCIENGLDIPNMTAEEFLISCRRLCEDAALKDTQVSVHWQQVTETMLNSAIYSSGFNSVQFRAVAAGLKEYANTVLMPQYMQPTVIKTFSDGSVITAQSNAYNGDTDNYLYETAISYDQAIYLLSLAPDLSVAPIPSEAKNTGYGFFLMVNPYSDNLSETLDFIGALSQDKMSDIKDVEYTTHGQRQLEELYQNTDIIIGIPDEIYYDDFERYLGSELTLDEFVAEAQRKYSAYINE